VVKTKMSVHARIQLKLNKEIQATILTVLMKMKT